jgi:hypothetical protein
MLPEPVRRLWPSPDQPLSRQSRVKSGPDGGAGRGALRQAKREIHHAIARARARGVRAQDLPLLESRPKRSTARDRRRPARTTK